MDLRRAEPLIHAWGHRQLGEKVGEVRRERECTRPGLASTREEAKVRVGRQNIYVPRMQRRDRDASPPEDEVLGVFADLGWRKAAALAYLMESDDKY